MFNINRETSKGHALARDPRVVICVDDPRPPYSFVQVQGMAEVTEDPDELLDIATRTGARYMGGVRAEEFGRNAIPGELVARVRPTKVIAGFDISDRPARASTRRVTRNRFRTRFRRRNRFHRV